MKSNIGAFEKYCELLTRQEKGSTSQEDFEQAHKMLEEYIKKLSYEEKLFIGTICHLSQRNTSGRNLTLDAEDMQFSEYMGEFEKHLDMISKMNNANATYVESLNAYLCNRVNLSFLRKFLKSRKYWDSPFEDN